MDRTWSSRSRWSGAVFACYLAYVVFDVWWYSRFLLPALPFLIVLSLMVLAELLRRGFGRTGLVVTVLISLGLSLWWLRTAEQIHAFDLHAFERHFVDAGNFVGNRLPQNAVVFTVKNSGSVRFYSGRPTIAWDSLDREEFDRAVDSIRQAGYAPYLLLEWEEEHHSRTGSGDTVCCPSWTGRRSREWAR